VPDDAPEKLDWATIVEDAVKFLAGVSLAVAGMLVSIPLGLAVLGLCLLGLVYLP
jgi:hypothetical protein